MNLWPHKIAPRLRRRLAGVTLEFIVASMAIVIVVMGTFLFGVTMTVHHAVTTAAAEGAREGAKTPTTIGAPDGVRVLDAVEATVAEVLSTHGLTIGPASGVMVVVEDSTGVDCRGEAIVACPGATSVTDPAEVRVRVLVNFDDANIPNLLATFGIDMSGKRLETCSVARRDCP